MRRKKLTIEKSDEKDLEVVLLINKELIEHAKKEEPVLPEETRKYIEEARKRYADLIAE